MKEDNGKEEGIIILSKTWLLSTSRKREKMEMKLSRAKSKLIYIATC